MQKQQQNALAIPVDAVGAPEFKRYRFEGTSPYRRRLRLFSALALAFGALLFALAVFAVSRFKALELTSWVQAAGIAGYVLLTLALFGYIALALIYFFPPTVWGLFDFGTPFEVKKLGLKLARSWEKEAPKFFAGLQDPIRNHLFYPGLMSLVHLENQLVIKVKVPATAVAGGIEEYAKSAAQEMENRLRIPVKAVAFHHDTYADSSGQKTKPDKDSVRFVLTPVDYSLMTRQVVLR